MLSSFYSFAKGKNKAETKQWFELLSRFSGTNKSKGLLICAEKLWDGEKKTESLSAQEREDAKLFVALVDKTAKSVGLNDSQALISEVETRVKFVNRMATYKKKPAKVLNRKVAILFEILSKQLYAGFKPLSREDFDLMLIKVGHIAGNPTELAINAYRNGSEAPTQYQKSRRRLNREFAFYDPLVLSTLKRRLAPTFDKLSADANTCTTEELLSYLDEKLGGEKAGISSESRHCFDALLDFVLTSKLTDATLQQLQQSIQGQISEFQIEFLYHRKEQELPALVTRSIKRLLLKLILETSDRISLQSDEFQTLKADSVLKERAVQHHDYCEELLEDDGNGYKEKCRLKLSSYFEAQIACTMTMVHYRLARKHFQGAESLLALVEQVRADIIRQPSVTYSLTHYLDDMSACHPELYRFRWLPSEKELCSAYDLRDAAKHFGYPDQASMLRVLDSIFSYQDKEIWQQHNTSFEEFYEEVRHRLVKSITVTKSKEDGNYTPLDQTRLDNNLDRITRNVFLVIHSLDEHG
ncbi:hypothetical protein [Agarivorans gilvus]|uniref:Uncharacterized protein n=1 Tax=Agarivorans gilvus TaxID=680279 RepID=A0ABQ1I0S6_9ALTE|nr:hypothetical protein [Agarivorans gilvus]GGB05362.1 hypothetical protein GCM10007414_18370 [Agarivorans gilvus]